MIVPLSHRNNQSSLFLKKNPNLTRILSYTLFRFLLLTNIHAFAEKSLKFAKIGSKLSVKLTAEISDGFKKLNLG